MGNQYVLLAYQASLQHHLGGKISPTVTITPATPGPSSETMSVSMQGMMKEMVRLMQNMAKGEKGHEEVIDLSQVPKAGSCNKSGMEKENHDGKDLNRLGPRKAQNLKPPLALRVSPVLPVMMAIH